MERPLPRRVSSYQTVVHGQLVTVNRYEYLNPPISTGLPVQINTKASHLQVDQTANESMGDTLYMQQRAVERRAKHRVLRAANAVAFARKFEEACFD